MGAYHGRQGELARSLSLSPRVVSSSFSSILFFLAVSFAIHTPYHYFRPRCSYRDPTDLLILGSPSRRDADMISAASDIAFGRKNALLRMNSPNERPG